MFRISSSACFNGIGGKLRVEEEVESPAQLEPGNRHIIMEVRSFGRANLMKEVRKMEQSKKKPSFYKISVGKLDILMLVMVAAGVTLLFDGPDKATTHVVTISIAAKAGLALLATALTALLATWGADMDRRCAEDYAFQLIANAAVIAVITTMFVHLIWDMNFLNEMGLPKPASGDIIGVMMLSWAFGYYFYRARGLKQ